MTSSSQNTYSRVINHLVIPGANVVNNHPVLMGMRNTHSGNEFVTTRSLNSTVSTVISDVAARTPGTLIIFAVTFTPNSSQVVTSPHATAITVIPGSRIATFYRVVTDSEPTEYTFNFSISTKVVITAHYVDPLTYDPDTTFSSGWASYASSTTSPTPALTLPASFDGRKNTILRLVFRPGISGSSTNVVTAFPGEAPHARSSSWGLGSATESGCIVSCAEVFEGLSVPARNLTFGTAYASAAVTMAIKGLAPL
jgi:hypothetical protein